MKIFFTIILMNLIVFLVGLMINYSTYNGNKLIKNNNEKKHKD